jgi:hypothetical protein
MAYKGSYGTSCIIVDIRKKRRKWLNKGKANCSKCKWLMFGYYCGKKKQSAVEVNKPKHCNFYQKK